ncbi:hypothetical protein QR680_001186 [Steinernema hermaphroditum]|uniref:Long-chain-fatty-acid--CoA ligase n=1 Tax=Steinernema hermaphroditum TaxID=289476 RepID=A0AA39LFK7_9BILA|nr:hypothetical protein QR680_001186 [Steinernema hermaphroditum]
MSQGITFKVRKSALGCKSQFRSKRSDCAVVWPRHCSDSGTRCTQTAANTCSRCGYIKVRPPQAVAPTETSTDIATPGRFFSWNMFGQEFVVGTVGTVAVTVVGVVIYYISQMSERKKLQPPPGVSVEKQAVEIKGQKGVYKSGLLADSEENVIEKFWPEVSTLYEAFQRGLDISNNGPCLGYRTGEDQPYTFINYVDVHRMAREIGAALIGKFGLKAGNETHVGLYSKNCPEWFITALGCIQHSIVVVPLYDTLGAESASFIVRQTDISVIIVDNVEKIKKLASSKTDHPTLRHIIVIDNKGIDDEIREKAKEAGIEITSFKDALLEGRLSPQKFTPPKADDTYLICYTSGTTGNPKGVVLSHRNLIANLAGFFRMLDSFKSFGAFETSDCLISYLPLSHMFEQMCHWASMSSGSSIGYFRGSVQGLTSDLKELKPTIFPVVPRLLNRMYDGIQAKLRKSSTLKRMLFERAYKAKVEQLKTGIVQNNTFWDKLVFKPIRELTGGRVRYMAVGSAPISAEVLETCRVALGATILEGYGQTECTAIATMTWPSEFTAGHCGAPAPCTTMKLGDVPELNYFASEGKGEIRIKGPAVTSGYYKDPEKTADLFDEDGFLCTGDIGEMRPNGTIRVIDRKKHIFKLAQGEYVAPEKIENVYVRTGSVQQVYVDGDSLERSLVAIVVPEFHEIKKWYKANISEEEISNQELCLNKQVVAYVLDEMRAIGKANKLNSIEQVQSVYLESEPFSVENGLLTPTMKAKRPQLRLKYKETMAALYKAQAAK